MVGHAFKLNVGRQGFGSVNLEIRIIEDQIIEVLLYLYEIRRWGDLATLFEVYSPG